MQLSSDSLRLITAVLKLFGTCGSLKMRRSSSSASTFLAALLKSPPDGYLVRYTDATLSFCFVTSGFDALLLLSSADKIF